MNFYLSAHTNFNSIRDLHLGRFPCKIIYVKGSPILPTLTRPIADLKGIDMLSTTTVDTDGEIVRYESSSVLTFFAGGSPPALANDARLSPLVSIIAKLPR